MSEPNWRSYNNQYGFDWSGIDVFRMAIIRGRRVLGIKTKHHELEIIFSPKLRRVEVWLDGKKLD